MSLPFLTLFETTITLSGSDGNAHTRQALYDLIQRPGWTMMAPFVFRNYGEEGMVSLELKPFGNEWRLSFIGTAKQWRGRGLASRALAEITQAADQAGVIISSSVDPQKGGSMGKRLLTQWYQRHGFVSAKYGDMRRSPQS